MADEDATISYAGAGEGEGSQPDPIDEGSETRTGPYVSEDDDEGDEPPVGDGGELEDDGGQGGDPDAEADVETGRKPTAKAAAPKSPELIETERRLQEKESQTNSLTIALRQERERSRILERRFYQVIDRAMQQEKSATPAPDDPPAAAEGEPENDVDAIRNGLTRVEQMLKERSEEAAEERSARATDDALVWVRQDAERTIQSTPDYVEAARVVEDDTRRSMRAHIQLQNPEFDEIQLEEAVEHVFAGYVAKLQVQCMQKGSSYAEAVLRAARTLGWQGGAAPAGKPPARSPQLEAERAARAGAPSLSRVPSAPPRQQPKATDLLQMSDDEFDDYLEKSKINPRVLAEQLASGART